MKKSRQLLVFIPALLLQVNLVWAQEPQQSIPSKLESQKSSVSPTEEVFSQVEEPASFPGGTEAMYDFITKNIQYPASAKEKGIMGKVYMRFTVNRDGKLVNIYAFKGLSNCAECDAEGIRVIMMMPAWTPGKIGGKAVNSFYNLPISFQ